MDPANRRLKIFLVENHDDTFTFLSAYLQASGHEVTGARSMGSALEVIGKEKVDVLISDVGLPDGDGWELIRQVPETKKPSFAIAMSGYGSPADREKSLRAGFHHHLVKPFLPEELDSLLAKAAQMGSPDVK